MNERIKELAEQAENYAAEQSDKFGVSYKKEYNKKFAELIVKECVDISRSHQNFPETEQTVRRWVAEDIVRHFGVEE